MTIRNSNSDFPPGYSWETCRLVCRS